MNTRDDFLRRIAEDPDDDSTRQVYADWLEEQGDDDEAERQRSWTRAKEWLLNLYHDGSRPWQSAAMDDDDGGYYYMSFDRMMESAAEAAADGSYSFSCGASEGVQDELNHHRAEFWRNWSIVSGVPVPPDVEDRGYFSCAC